MGPRSIDRGKSAELHLPAIPHRCFNGASINRSRKGPTRCLIPRISKCFNGASINRSRKGAMLVGVILSAKELQWGLDQSIEERTHGPIRRMAKCLLQWGLDQSIEESTRILSA